MIEPVDHRQRVRGFCEKRLASYRWHPEAWAQGKEAFIMQVVDTYEMLYLVIHERAEAGDAQDFQCALLVAICGDGNRVPTGSADSAWARDVLDKARAYAATRMIS